MSQLSLLPQAPLKEVAQHNQLIFAPFALNTLETRIFISMLERIERSDETFPEWKIPITDIIPYQGGNYYLELKKASDRLVRHVVNIAPVRPDGRRANYPRTLVKRCDHVEGTKHLVCQFHDHIREYLLKLIGNFTRADLAVLKKFKDEKSVRFYWMLKARFYKSNTVEITVDEVRDCLLPQGSTAYQFPTEIRRHILEKIIKPELEETDCAFDFGEPVKLGSKTYAWTFISKTGSVTVLEEPPITLPESVLNLLATIKMDRKGIRRIDQIFNTQQEGQLIDEPYIRFVIDTVKQNEKVSNLAGYVIDALNEGWLAKFYKKTNPTYTPPKSKKAENGPKKRISADEIKGMYALAVNEGRFSGTLTEYREKTFNSQLFDWVKENNGWWIVEK